MNKSSAGRRYNWHRDLPDQRDIPYSLASPSAAPPSLPVKVDLTPLCSPIMNQGDEGSCTAHALAGAYEFLELKELRALYSGTEVFAPSLFSPVSRNFIYWNERVLEGTQYQDSGAQIRDGIKTLASLGVCREKLWPYFTDDMFIRPTDEAFAEATKHKITSYARLATLLDMQNCLAAGNPFAFGFTVYEGFESPDVAAHGIAQLPGRSERPIGGHAVLAVGYSNVTNRFLVRNSWGVTWGQAGYFALPYAYLTNPNLAADFWTISK